MEAKIQNIRSLKHDFEVFRLFHFLKVVIEIAFIILLCGIMYGCVCEIFGGTSFFGILLRGGIICLLIKAVRFLFGDLKHRLAVGKKKMRNCWEKMCPDTTWGYEDAKIRNMGQKVRTGRRMVSTRKFQTQVMVGCALLLAGYVLMYLFLGLDGGYPPGARIWLTQVMSVALGFGFLGGIAWLSWRYTTKKVRKNAAILAKMENVYAL